jgi:DNA-binding NarL/FixJ family response regulator
VRVLLADDHALVRRGMRALLEQQAGVTVIGEAADGIEAVALCEQHHPDVAVLDVAMPRLSGIDAAERVRRLPRPPHVIMLSMHADGRMSCAPFRPARRHTCSRMPPTRT